MNELQKLFDGPFGNVRVVTDTEGVLWFSASDVCRCLTIHNVWDVYSNIPTYMKRDDLGLTDAIGRVQSANMINEAGFYYIVMRSRKPVAQQFAKWVYEDVLPSIRKYGGYITEELSQQANYDPTVLNDLKAKLDFERQQRIAEQPLIDMANTFLNTDNCLTMQEFADSVHPITRLGRNQLFKWMREHRYLMQGNVPYANFLHQGLFKVIQKPIDFGNWSKTQSVTLVTPKGCLYFTKVFKKNF